MKYSILLSFLIFAPQAHGTWFKDFCAKYIVSADPYEGIETVREARAVYPDDDEFHEFLKDLYYWEINRPDPRETILKAIEQEFGGKP